MGVYCQVDMCVVGTAPLPLDLRVAIVELAIEHQLLADPVWVSVPVMVEPRGLVERVKHLFGVRRTRRERVGEGPPGPWIAERLRALGDADDIEIGSARPLWKGELATGPFVYRVTRRPRAVKTSNAYRSPEERSPHEPPDGLVGEFHDVLSLDAKRDLDGRIAASSSFVRALKKLTGAKVICRASWY